MQKGAVRVRKRRKKREKEKKEWDKMKDMWRDMSGEKKMMKSSTANQVMTHGEGVISLFFSKSPTIIKYTRTLKSINPII